MGSDLFSLLNANNVLGKKPKAPRRPATTTRPRPTAPSPSGGGGRGIGSLLTQNIPYQSVAPKSNGGGHTEYHNPSTGGRQRSPIFSPPIQGDYRLSSEFGPRTHPVTGRSSNHTGLDFAASLGTPIYAPRAGLIEEANSNDSIYGNQVIMRNGPELQTMYGHMDKFAVEPGQRLKRGDLIGYVGSTGLSTGPHLHWETWKNGNPVNPHPLFNPDLPRRLPRIPGEEAKPKLRKPKQPGLSAINDQLAGLLDPSNVLPNRVPPKPQAPSPVGPSQAPGGGDPRLQAFLRAISTQESGDNYGAIGVDTGGGHRAYGKYQIMDFNINGPGGWDQEALGQEIDINQFLNSPELQEKIARAKLASYFKEYGPAGAAKAWYAGPGNANTYSNAPQYGGPSINGYANSVLAHMKDYL